MSNDVSISFKTNTDLKSCSKEGADLTEIWVSMSPRPTSSISFIPYTQSLFLQLNLSLVAP